MEKMTGEEIRNRIGEIYQEMEVDELQTLCIHEFQDGVCIYCGREED